MQLTGLGLGLLGDFKKVAKGGVAGVVTPTGLLGAGGWGRPLVLFSSAWAASAARDSWYSRNFLFRFLSPVDHFSFSGDALLLLPCSVRSSPGSRDFFSIMSHIEMLIVAPDGYSLGFSSSSI